MNRMANCRAIWEIASSMMLTLLIPAGAVLADSEEPASLKFAREAYENAFVRVVEPIQRKYRQALEQHQRMFSQNGALDSAREARNEIIRVNLWRTIPEGRVKGSRDLKEPQLNSLLKSYETAVLATIEPVTKSYVAKLLRLEGTASRGGDLDDLVLIDQRLKAAQSGQSLPVKVGERRYLSGLSKKEFAEWLQGQKFEFSGIIAGRTELTFDAEKVVYGSGAQAPIYEYELSGNRKVEINKGLDKGGFTMEFSRDLQSATFISRRGEYPVEIKPPVVN